METVFVVENSPGKLLYFHIKYILLNRVPKDFQPRAKIKKMFSDGMLTTEEELQQFLEKFAVKPHLIKAYIAHLEDLKI